MARKRRLRGTGTTRQLPSGRWQAVHTGADGEKRSAGYTFDTKLDAGGWLKDQTGAVDGGRWEPPEARKAAAGTLEAYAATWLAGRALTPRTRALYADLLAKVINPDLGPTRLDKITPATIKAWYATLNAATPTRRAHAYALVRTILGTAAVDDLIPTNPCKIVGAGQVKRAKNIRPATLGELAVIVEAMPARLRLLALLASWCALRFGEATELRRRDVDVKAGILRIRRGVTHVDGVYIVGAPKSAAGSRDVAIPPHLIPLVEAHLERFAQPGADGLLFPAAGGGHLATTTLYGAFYPARHLAGRDDLRFHDLRHTGAVLAASTGATLAELMARLGHSTPAMALRYQHAAAGRDREIAAKLSQLADGRPS
jgi:integrase